MLTIYKKDSSNHLLEVVNSIREEPNAYVALQFNFSDLLEHYKTDYQQKISLNIIIDLLKEATGSVLVLDDYDIFVICKNADNLKVKKLIFQLRYLYMDDPLAYDELGEDNPKFSTIFELEKEWMSFYAVVRAKIKQLGLSKPNKIARANNIMLTTEKLSEIEASIGKFNIAPVLRQQPICHSKDDNLRIMFTETYINISALAELLNVNIDFASNRWLFKHFTNLLDIRVIELLKKTPAKYVRKPVSLNFNVQTILSNIFTEFAASLDAAMKKNIVVEIQVIDVFADMQAFRTARDLLQSQGFRLCLDGMDALSFRQLDRNSLGFDLAKMYWNADLKKDTKSEQNLRLKDAIEDCGKSRVILCRCDTQEAIDYGKTLGISLFQGRYIDEQIDPSAEILN